MSFSKMLGVVGAMAGTASLALYLTRQKREVVPEVQGEYEECVFEQVNKARRSHGLSEVARDPELDDLGHRYSKLMRDTGRFAHRIDGRSVGDRFDAYGIDFSRAAENLQRNDFDDCESACMETVWGSGGWMQSKLGHREAMLDPSYDKAGVGVQDDGRSWHVAMYFRKV